MTMIAKKRKQHTKTDDDDLVADTTNTSLHSNTLLSQTQSPPALLRSETYPMPASSSVYSEDCPGFNTQTPPPLFRSPVDPPPPHVDLISGLPDNHNREASAYLRDTSDSEPSSTRSTRPACSAAKPSTTRKRLQSLKTAVEDGRARSFATAAYAGGAKAQSSFLKAETCTHAVKTGNTPLVAMNAARAVYRGGKEARRRWKGAEEERKERLVREGKIDANGNSIVVVAGVEGCEQENKAQLNDETDQAEAEAREKK
ncbi:hypothetical protein N0V90_007786 [Kalmusia sp. IMI 367209]|nr:hypothetical protein N0V90_007786 [Kalmusia sp. IMI 367209]